MSVVTTIEDPRDVLVVHQGEGLPFTFEASGDLLSADVGLDQFDRDLATYRLELFGSPDIPHAAGAEPLDEAIGADLVGQSQKLREGRLELGKQVLP